jgi:hypothetical protein
LTPDAKPLLALAHLRNGDTYTRLASGFEIGVATVIVSARTGFWRRKCGRI